MKQYLLPLMTPFRVNYDWTVLFWGMIMTTVLSKDSWKSLLFILTSVFLLFSFPVFYRNGVCVSIWLSILLAAAFYECDTMSGISHWMCFAYTMPLNWGSYPSPEKQGNLMFWNILFRKLERLLILHGLFPPPFLYFFFHSRQCHRAPMSISKNKICKLQALVYHSVANYH